MKKLKLIAVSTLLSLFFALDVTSLNAQCTPPPYMTSNPSWATDNFMVLDEAEVDIYYDYQLGDTREYYGAKCGANPITLRYITENDRIVKLKIYTELWKQEYDCNGVIIVGTHSLVETSPEIIYNGNTSPINIDFNVNVEANHSYRVKTFARAQIIGSWYGAPTTYESPNLRFIAPGNTPEPNGNFTNVLSIDSRSAYNGWVVDVDQLDVNGVFNFDASPTSCETNWRYYIKEFDLATWTSNNTYASPLINGQAGNIDMDAVYPYGFQKGRVYMLTLVAGPGWYAKNYWFEMKDARICGHISNNGVVYEAVPQMISVGEGPSELGGIQIQIYERCQYNGMRLYTSCTESEDVYKITLQAVDASYSSVGLPQTTGWLSGPVSSEYHIESLFGALGLGQRYKLTYEVRDPNLIKTFYFRYKTCSQVGEPDDPSGRLKSPNQEVLEELTVYPNPSNTLFFVEVPISENGFQVEIYNLNGSIVYEKQNIQEYPLQIELTDQKAGIYLLKVISNGKSYTKRIIKQ